MATGLRISGVLARNWRKRWPPAVAAFDTLVGQYAKQLADQVPMTARRTTRLTKHSFHDLDEVNRPGF